MPAAWTVADDVLQKMLGSYLRILQEGYYWTVDLYMNDYIPQPGDTFAEYDIADFDGYAGVQIESWTWGAVEVVDHVAISTHPTTCAFVADDTAEDQTIYGYLITDQFGDLVWAERWAEPVVMHAGDSDYIQPVIRHGIDPFV